MLEEPSRNDVSHPSHETFRKTYFEIAAVTFPDTLAEVCKVQSQALLNTIKARDV